MKEVTNSFFSHLTTLIIPMLNRAALSILDYTFALIDDMVNALEVVWCEFEIPIEA